MQNNTENSTTDNTNEKQSSNATGSIGKKKMFEFRSMLLGGFRGQADHGDDEPSVDEFDDAQGQAMDRKFLSKQNTRTMRVQPVKVGLGIDTDPMRPLDARLNAVSAGLKPGSTRNAQRLKRMKNLNHLMSPRADIDDARSASSQSAATAKGYNDAATLMMTDIDIFGNELNQYANGLKQTLMEKRCASGHMRDEPQEELEEVYAEISALEEDFKKALGISQHLLGHSRHLITENQELTFNLDSLKHENQLMQQTVASHTCVVKQQEEIWGQSQEQSKQLEKELAGLREELDERDRELLAKQAEITELNLLLDSREKKIDNIQSMEDTSGIKIRQHPEYKRLQEELTAMAEEVRKCKASHTQLQTDHKSSMKKSKALMTQLLDSEQQCQQLRDQVAAAEKNVEKLRKQRNEYKTAWENSDAKMQQQAQEWKNKKYDFKEEIADLKEQLDAAQDRRTPGEASTQEQELSADHQGTTTFCGDFQSMRKREGQSNDASAIKKPDGLGLPSYRSNTNSVLSTTEIVRGREFNNSLLQAEQLNHAHDIMDNSYLNNTATGLDASILRDVQDTSSNLNASIVSHGGGDARFYQPARGTLRGPGRSGGPSLNNSYLMMDKSFMDQAVAYQGEAEEKEVVVEETDELVDTPPRLDERELVRKLEEEVVRERRVGEAAEDEGGIDHEEGDFSYRYASPRPVDRKKGAISSTASPSVSELVGQLTIRPRAELEDSEDEKRVINVKMIGNDEAEHMQKVDLAALESEGEGARCSGGAGPVSDRSMHKAAPDQRCQEVQTDLQGLEEMASLLAGKKSKEQDLSLTAPKRSLDAELGPKKQPHLQVDAYSQTASPPPTSSVTLDEAAAALIATDHASSLAVSPGSSTQPSQKPPKPATHDKEGQQEDLEQLVQQVQDEKNGILCQLDEKLKENIQLIEKNERYKRRIAQMEREIDRLEEAKAFATKYKDEIATHKRIGRREGQPPAVVEAILKPYGRSRSQTMNDTLSLIFRQSPSDGSFSPRVESLVPPSGDRMASASKQANCSQLSRTARAPLSSALLELGASDDVPKPAKQAKVEPETTDPEPLAQEKVQPTAPTRKQISEQLVSQQSYAVTQILPLTNQVDEIMECSSAADSSPPRRDRRTFSFRSRRKSSNARGRGAPEAESPKNQRSDSFVGTRASFRGGDLGASMVSVSAASPSLGIRKDPNLEFFQMLLLSYKMNNQDLEEVMELDHREMYLKCTNEEKVTFFHFPDWIAKEINKIRFRKVYHQNKKRLERNKRLLNKLEAMDGIKFVQDVKILHNYFEV